MSGGPAPLLVARGLRKRYRAMGGGVEALAGVDLEIGRGEIVGLVGESGSGKSTLARLLVRLESADGGSVTFDGADLDRLDGRQLRAARSRFQLVFQDAGAALDPRLDLGAAVSEPLAIRGEGGRAERRALAAGLLAEVGLGPELVDRFPHELSGGQRQRVGIARALATAPDLLVADEAVSALDLSIRGQVVNLLLDLRSRRGLAILFVSHDLGLVARIADRVAVLCGGELVEVAPPDALRREPQHPYTAALLAAAGALSARATAAGGAPEMPLPVVSFPVEGCRFAPRCPIAADRCRAVAPRLAELLPGRWVACHDPGRVRAGSPRSRVEPFPDRDVMNNNAEGGANQRGHDA